MNKAISNIIKVQIFILLNACVLSVNSQDSINNKVLAFESQIYPSWNSDTYKPIFKARLILKENHVLRSNFSIVNQKKYREIFSSNGPNDGVGSVESIYQFFSFSFGYEHLTNYNRISVYNGFEFVFGVGRDDVYGSRTDSISFIADQNYNTKVPLQHFGLKLFSGLDFKITPNLYVGTEIGLLLLKTQRKIGTYQILDESSTTSQDVTTSIPLSSNTNLLFNGVGSIRVGWFFGE